MTPEEAQQIRQKIERLERLTAALLVGDRLKLPNLVELNADVGTMFGLGTQEKIGFYGTTPIIQRSGSAQAAVSTTGATNTSPWGYTTEAQANAIVTLVNELRAWAVAQGFIKGSS